MPEYTDAQMAEIANAYYEQVLAPSSGNVPPEAMVMACSMMLAAALYASHGPEIASFARAMEVGNAIAGMIDRIHESRTGQKPVEPANDEVRGY